MMTGQNLRVIFPEIHHTSHQAQLWARQQPFAV
jgi:hypothetical protein